MQLKLERPLVFFDLETTGTNILKDRIVEISILKVSPDGTVLERTRRINPEMPIPAEATAIHHITDQDVADQPPFRSIAVSLSKLLTGCDIAGYNSTRFDVPLLDEEFRRAGIRFDFSDVRFIDVQTIFHKMEQRTLSAAYRFYCDKELDGAHSANADTLATYEVLMAQLDRYPSLENDVAKLAAFSSQTRNVDFAGRLIYDDQGREIINFGKHKGRPAEEVLEKESGYYGWVMQGDFSSSTKDAFTAVYRRVRERKNNRPDYSGPKN